MDFFLPKKNILLLCCDANTGKIVMATVEFISITSNTFILVSHSRLDSTHLRHIVFHDCVVAARWQRWWRYNCFSHSNAHTYRCTQTLCALPRTHWNASLWINKNVHVTAMKGNSSSIHKNMWARSWARACVCMRSSTVKCSRHFSHFHFDYRIYECRMNSFFSFSFHLKHSFVNLFTVFLC